MKYGAKSLLALTLAVALAGNAALPCLAQGLSTPETAAVQDTVASGGNVGQNLEQDAILQQVLTLSAGTDYKENCVLLHADSEEQARFAAEKVNATVAYYSDGSATLLCENSVVETLNTALACGVELPLLYPNRIYHMEDALPQLSELTESTTAADSASGSALYNDPELGTQWYHNYIGSTAAWANGVTGAGVTVAVLDSGVVANHPDLQVARYIDSLRVYSAANGGTPYDSCGHGTSVAGVIAATANNGIGGVGVAPGVTLISCKAADNQDNFYDDTLNWGIHDAVDAGANVINISCDFPSDNSGYLAEAIAYAKNHGCIIVASAGNDGTNAARYLPAHADVIGVGALTTGGQRADYSNFGANVNLMAPGTSLYTPGLDGSFNPYFGATSGAAAVVSGAVALSIAANPSLLAIVRNGTGDASFVETVEQRLYNAANPLGDSTYNGYGAVNLIPLLGSTADEAQITAFVTRLYNTCLGRSPDTAGLKNWVTNLMTGRQTGAQTAYGFIFSAEFKNKNYCNTDYVKQLYRAFLGRDYDTPGLNSWLGNLTGGATREEVFNGFSQSAEFRELCSSYGITLGTAIAVPQYGTVPTGACSVCGEMDGVTAFVTRMYKICLNRNPDVAGRNNWTAHLWDHSYSGRQVAYGFIFSDEFQGKNYSNADYVEHLYEAFLGRGSDAQGKAHWVAMLNHGSTRMEIFNGFVASQEFLQICNSYGIVRS